MGCIARIENRHEKQIIKNGLEVLGKDFSMQLYLYCVGMDFRADHSTSGP